MKNKKKRNAPAVCAGILASALSVSAAVRTLPTPPPSEFVDAESSVNVSLPTTEGRHIRLTLDFDPSPTNAVQVAFGRDDDGDGDLAPEETVVRLGVDCGVPFVWKESKSKVAIERSEIAEGLREQWNLSTYSAGQPEQEGNILCSPSTFAFDLKQPKAVSARWDLAKVTTHNVAATNVAVSAKFYNKGFALILR